VPSSKAAARRSPRAPRARQPADDPAQPALDAVDDPASGAGTDAGADVGEGAGVEPAASVTEASGPSAGSPAEPQPAAPDEPTARAAGESATGPAAARVAAPAAPASRRPVRLSARSGDLPSVSDLLATAVAAIGGAQRPGQVQMAEAVRHTLETGEHLAVQAGTGTGKSLAYLVPAIRHAVEQDTTVVVSTATIALQRQLIDRDLPRLADALTPSLGRAPVFAILKGRRNYLCLLRAQGDAPAEPEDTLFDPAATSATGRQVVRLHEWAAETTTGDRDELVPGVEDRAWRQVSVSAQECIGAQRCPFGTRCHSERARELAGHADVVVTNHALLAIDAIENFDVLPEHDAVIIDEAHELVDRVTSVAAAELSAPGIEAAARRCGKMVDEKLIDDLRKAGEGIEHVAADLPDGRLDFLPDPLGVALAAVRDGAAACAAQLRTTAAGGDQDLDRVSAARAAAALLDELGGAAGEMLKAFAAEIAARPDVVWLDRPPPESSRPVTLRVAPLEVGGLLAGRLFGRQTVALTSATLSLGGSFEPLARQWGLPLAGARPRPPAPGPPGSPSGGPAAPAQPGPAGGPARPPGGPARPQPADRPARPEQDGEPAPADRPARRDDEPEQHSLDWTGLDVGSPFDHPRSGILYVARHLPPPGRDGLPEAYLTELRELITAAGGRTLGLFSSMRAAKQAAAELREPLAAAGFPLLCQGEDSTSLLVTQFAADEPTCLFGTISLWQGVDVPGPSLQLVVIDRIPFPRPDDPLASARQRTVAARGGNGFMTVAASHAALLLAQGSGRLLRTMTDKGVVAVLDPRLGTARYSGFLRSSLPPFWTTSDPQVVRGALRRLAGGTAAG
jgi:ATP-dependent DNA helicase DinG